MSVGLYRTAAEDAAIGGRTAYSALEFLDAVNGKQDNATIKVGTRQRFHSADGVYNRGKTLRETREAFRQAIVSTFGAAGEEALRKSFDGVSDRPLTARMIRRVYSEAQMLAARRALDETLDRNGVNVFGQIINEQLQGLMPQFENIFAADGNAQPFTEEMKAAARAVCLRDLHQTFNELIAQRGVGQQALDGSILNALAERAQASLLRIADKLRAAVNKLRLEGVDMAQTFTRPDLPQALLLSEELDVSLRFLDHIKAQHPEWGNASAERLLNELEVRVGKAPTRHPVDAADKLAGAFKAFRQKLETDMNAAISDMRFQDRLNDEVSVIVGMLIERSAEPLEENDVDAIRMGVMNKISRALCEALLKEMSTPSALGAQKWKELRLRVVHQTAMDVLIQKGVEKQVDSWVASHPGLDRNAARVMAKTMVLNSPVGRQLLNADSHDAMSALGRARREIQRMVEDLLVRKDAERVAVTNTQTQLISDIKATLKELVADNQFRLGFDLDSMVNKAFVEKIVGKDSPEKAARKANEYLSSLRDLIELMRDAPLISEQRSAMMRDLFRDCGITPEDIGFAVRVFAQGPMAGDCGFANLPANNTAVGVQWCFERFGERVQRGLGNRVVEGVEQRRAIRLASMHMLLLLHPDAAQALFGVPGDVMQEVCDLMDERNSQIREDLARLPKFASMRTEAQVQDARAKMKELRERDHAVGVIADIEMLKNSWGIPVEWQ